MSSHYRILLVFTLLVLSAITSQHVHADIIPVSITSNSTTAGIYSVAGIGATTASFQWTVSTNGTISGSATGATVTVAWSDVSAQTTGTIMVQVLTIEGDTGTTTLTVTIYPRPAITISGDFTMCSGKTHVYSASDSRNTGGSFGWVVSGGAIIGSATNSTVTVQWNNTNEMTTSSLRATGYEPHGFNSSSVASVAVYPNPALAIAGDAALCNGAIASYTATDANNTGITGYAWAVEGGSIQGAANGAVLHVLWNEVAAITARTITVVGAGANGCLDTAEFVVTVYPDPVLAISGNAAVCPEVAAYAVSDANLTGVTSYTWVVEGGVIRSTPDSHVVDIEWYNVTTVTTRTITVVGAGVNGCRDTAEFVVTVYPQPDLALIGDADVCSEIAAYVVTDANNTGITGYAWTVEGGTIQGASNGAVIDIEWNEVTTITSRTLTVMGAGANGCPDTTTFTVTVYPNPGLYVSGDTAVCSGETASYTVSDSNSTGITTYMWTVEGCVIQGAPNGTTITVLWDSVITTTQRSISVIGTGSNGCADTALQRVQVSLPFVVDAGADVTICAGSVVQLQATGGVSYYWALAPGISNQYSASPIVSPSSTTTYTVFAMGTNGCSSRDEVTVEVLPLELNISVLLEGAYNGTTMNDVLWSQGLIPPAQPFNSAPFNYAGTEINTGPVRDSVVDWVLVELRTQTSPGSTIARKAALLYRDGTIGDADGQSPLLFRNIPSGSDSLYIVVRHRNHLPVMSNIRVVPIPLPGTSTCELYHNFTSSQSAAYTQFMDPQRQLGTEYGMLSGDANSDGVINSGDRAVIRNASGQIGYLREDVSLDGIVNAVDRVLARSNVFYISQVP